MDFHFPDPSIAIVVDYTLTHQKEHGWVGNRMKERAPAGELRRALPDDFGRFDELFDLVSIASTDLTVAGLDIDVIYKDIKNLHMSVYPPAGRVRVAAPRRIDADAIRLR